MADRVFRWGESGLREKGCSLMDPFIWGFVRGGAAATAMGSPFLAAAFVHEGHPNYGWLVFAGGLLMLALFVVNERRRPW